MPAPARRTRRRSHFASPAAVESFERRLLFAIDVTIGTGSPAQAVVFQDGDGTTAQVRAAGGTATITFDAPDAAQSTTGKLVTVTGTGLTMANLVMGGPNPNVSVRATGGDNLVTLESLAAAGPVRGFSGRGVALTRDATLGNGIGLLELSRVQGAAIMINRSGQARLQDASITILSATDTAINSQQPMRLLRVGSWSAGIPGQPDAIITPRINVLQCGGDFNADVTLSGNGQLVGKPVLGSVRVLGALASGEWDVAGRTGKVAVASVASDWSGTFGDVSAFAVAGDLAGEITANSINSLSAGSITGADVELTRAFAPRATALNRLAVRGAVTDSVVRSSSDIGTISAANLTRSSIFAGVTTSGGDQLPSSLAAFVSPATIRSVTLHGGTGPNFVDSNVAASTIAKVNGGTVHVTNTGQQFGFAADTIGSISGTRDDTGESRRAVRLINPSDSIDLGDFEVRVF
jgi:hypothetical protein